MPIPKKSRKAGRIIRIEVPAAAGNGSSRAAWSARSFHHERTRNLPTISHQSVWVLLSTTIQVLSSSHRNSVSSCARQTPRSLSNGYQKVIHSQSFLDTNCLCLVAAVRGLQTHFVWSAQNRVFWNFASSSEIKTATSLSI